MRVRPARLPRGGGVGHGDRRTLAGAPTGRRPPAASLLAAAERGDPAAVAVLAEVAGHLAGAVALLAQTVDPELVVLGGGVADAGPGLLVAVQDALRARAARSPVLAAIQLADRVALVPEGVPAGALGAAVVARRHLAASDPATPATPRTRARPAPRPPRWPCGIGHVVSGLRITGGTVLGPGGPVRSDVFVAEGRIVSVRAVVGTTGQEHGGPDGRIENGTVGAGAERSVVDAAVQDDADPVAGGRTPAAGGVPGCAARALR